MKVLVLGASGMLGSAVFHKLCKSDGVEVYGAIRQSSQLKLFESDFRRKLVHGLEGLNRESIKNILNSILPDVVINCIAINHIGKTQVEIDVAYILNASLPHFLAEDCGKIGARLIHISTDGVFSGKKGDYSEVDAPDPIDQYGKQKLIGEIFYDNCVTLRTSMIGHSLIGDDGLVDWFLSQQNYCRGFSGALFSGLTTGEIAHIIEDIIIPNKSLQGLYHLSANPISKYRLLELIATEYGKKIELVMDVDYIINRTLDSTKFKSQTGYKPPDWDLLVRQMRIAHQKNK